VLPAVRASSALVLLRRAPLRTQAGLGCRQATQYVEHQASRLLVLTVDERVVRLVVVRQQAAVAAGLANGPALVVQLLAERSLASTADRLPGGGSA
jgi:hypothetical protein